MEMEKLNKIIQSSPELKSERSQWLQLAVKDERGAVVGTGQHKVRVIDCENAKNKDYKTGEMIQGVNLILEENNERKLYFIPTLGQDGKFHYLLEKFSQIKEGSEVIMEYQRKGVKGFIDVRPVEDELPDVQEGELSFLGEDEVSGTRDPKEIDWDSIPIVEEDDAVS